MENLNAALSLLAVGMVTVLIILGLVVVIGNVVIRLTNRFIPTKAPEETKSDNKGTGKKKMNLRKMAAIVAAVDVVTQGQGNIQSIEKREKEE